jgi:hypothetical protein
MALFKKNPLNEIKKLFDSLSADEQETFLKDLKADDEKADEVVDPEKDETAEAPVEQEAVEQEADVDEAPVEQDDNNDDEAKADDEVVDEKAVENETNNIVDELTTKITALESALAELQAKVQPILEKVENNEKPADSFGLGKKTEVAVDDDESLSAHDYAMKYAKY